MLDQNEYSVAEFQREKRAAENRLAEITVGDISTREVTVNGVTLYEDDLRMLAVIVEEQESLDRLLGLYMDGVSRSQLKDLFGFENTTRATYRLDKLENAGVIETDHAEDLPELPATGSAPVYVVPTERGLDLVDELGLVPILTRDRDSELVIDQLLDVTARMHDELILTNGRLAALMRELDKKVRRELYIEFDLREYDFREFGLYLGSLEEEPAFLQSRENDLLLGEMDSAQRELLLQKLLDEDVDADSDSDTDSG
jgi:hypothetical protein